MALADKTWTPVTFDEVVLEWCRAEKDTRLVNRIALSEIPGVDELLRSGDITDSRANEERYRRLLRIRGPLLRHIPRGTEWFSVKSLTDGELDELRVIFNCPPWSDPQSHSNELRRVATLNPESLRKPPERWERPILWGHNRSGPFTVIEGNHRLIGYASQKQPRGLSIPVLVGLSLLPCATWHIVDALP
jgi:hypothetical protein